jgi:parvulin-like peptidyl-prolyl isomerase
MIKSDFKILEDKGLALEVGGVSDPFETAVGWVVLKRTKYFRIHAKHLVVVHTGSPAARGILRTKDEAKARAEEALKKVTADPTAWAKVVAEYSDEPMAGAREGALLVEPGELVGEFEDAVLALAPGATSGVVESPFGYHVIRRLD